MTLDRKKLIDKLFGKNSQTPSLTMSQISVPDKIPTISPYINWILEGGIVPGRFYGLAGPPGAGKSQFAVSCVAQMLRNKPDSVAIWFDVEKAFSGHWLNIYMADMEQAYIDDHIKLEPMATYGKDIFDYFANKIIPLIQDGLEVSSCVIDSVQNIICPIEEAAKSTEDAQIAALARYLPGALRKIYLPSRMHAVTWFFVCQVRDKIDPYLYGMDKYTIPGGNAFHHLLDCVIMMVPSGRKEHKIFSETIFNADGSPSQLGVYVNAKVLNKSRLGVPNRMARYKLLYKNGIVDTHEEIVEMARNTNLFDMRGSHFYLNDKHLANGVAEMNLLASQDETLRNELFKLVMEKSAL